MGEQGWLMRKDREAAELWNLRSVEMNGVRLIDATSWRGPLE